MNRGARSGTTLIELVMVIAILAIIAAVVVPSLSYSDASKLAVAAEQVGNALRFARSEAMRTGQNVLVDAESFPGRVVLVQRGCTAVGTPPAVINPLTQRPFDVAVTEAAQSNGVQLAPRFLVAGTPWTGLVFDSTGAATQACSVAAQIARGTPEPGSGVELSYAGQTQTIAIDPPTGRVTGF